MGSRHRSTRAPTGLPLVAILVGLIGPAVTHAAVVSYQDSASFLAALGSAFTVVDFESAGAGTVLPGGGAVVDGVELSSAGAASGFDLLTTNLYDQTSAGGGLSLGLDLTDATFASGDGLLLRFSSAVRAVGLFVIGSPGDMQGGDVALSAFGETVVNAGTPETVLGDGGEAFFLGLIESDPARAATSAALESFDPGGLAFFFNVDDIYYAPPSVPVPIPAMASVLLVLPLAGLGWYRRPAASAAVGVADRG